MLPIKPPVELNEEQREAAEEAGLLDFLLGKEQTELARVVVPRHLRVVEGKVQDVDAYDYEREGAVGVGEALLNPPTAVRAASRPLTDDEFEAKYGQPRPKDGAGDCYVAAFSVMAEAEVNGEDMDDYRYCIGVPLGAAGSDIDGVRYDHAWVEKRKAIAVPPEVRAQWKELGQSDEVIDAFASLVTVYDYSNGLDYEGIAEMYYAAGRIRPEEVVRYTWDETMKLAEMNEWL